MIDPSANSRESHSDCTSVDTCEVPQNPRNASTTSEHNVIDCAVTCRSRIPADVAYIEALGRCFYHFSYKGDPITYGLGWGGQFTFVIPSKKAVVTVNESIDDATAIMASIVFLNRIFPLIYNGLN